jgi:AAA15 family ATPase/GTPase
MLIEFTVKNYKSIRDEQKLSMVAAKGDELRNSNTFIPAAPASEPLLRSAVIYGANASGKSNLLKALYAMQEMVVLSANLQAGKTLPVIPFLLDDASASAPTEFEVVFIADGVRYQYGFAANSSQVHEEWLFASPKGRSQLWFSRAWDADSKAYGWEFGKSFAGEKQLWQKSTRDNALFLTTAMQLNSKSLAPVFGWFASQLNILGADASPYSYTAKSCTESRTRAEVLAFLQAADFDIADLSVQVEPLTEKHLQTEIPPDVRSVILSRNDGIKMLETYTTHQTRQGRQVEFKLEDESDGTRKVFAFAGPWLDTLKNGGILFIDELHASLHPKLVHFLVGMFHNDQTNPRNAQLVFTTHDTSILNQEVFRRDQIWFFEKDRDQASHLYPLTDFHPRKDRENLLANYLDGRYGALPVFGDLAPAFSQQAAGDK